MRLVATQFRGDGSTGSTISRPHEDPGVLWARVRFLTVALMSCFITALVGVVVAQVTNSFAVEIDSISSLCDGISLVINIFVELRKSTMTEEKNILALDFMGGFISLALLVGVAVFGVVGATTREKSEYTPKESSVEHLGLMLAYNIFTIVLDIFTLTFWCLLRDAMRGPVDPVGDGKQDNLNVVSGLVHALVDFLRALSVAFTTVWMLYVTSRHETPWEEFKDKVNGDVFGSFLVCTCVLGSSAFLLRESLLVLWRIWHREDWKVLPPTRDEDQPLLDEQSAGQGATELLSDFGERPGSTGSASAYGTLQRQNV